MIRFKDIMLYSCVISISIVLLYTAISHSHNKCSNQDDYYKCMNI